MIDDPLFIQRNFQLRGTTSRGIQRQSRRLGRFGIDSGFRDLGQGLVGLLLFGQCLAE